MSTPLGITFDDVHLTLGDREVLRGIDLELLEHRVGVVGPNGSGKSSLVRLVNGLVSPTAGRVLVGGVDVARHAAAVRRQVGFLFPDADHQIVMPTVREDLAFSLRQHRMSRLEREAAVEDALARHGLTDHADHPCHLLSSGQKQVLALAAVLLSEPRIVIADEPTTLLDLRRARIATAQLLSLGQQVVLVTHHLDLVRDLDRVVVVDEGRIVADDEPEAALEWYVRTLG